MFCRIPVVAAAALLVSGAAWAQSGTTQTDTQSTTTTQTDTDTHSPATQTTTTTDTQATTQTSTGTSDDRPRLELTGFAGWTFNQTLDLTQSGGTTTVTSFYNSVAPRDRLSYGAMLGYDVTRNLMIGFRWSAENSKLRLSNFNSTAAAATGWKPSSGTSATGASGAGFPSVLLTSNGASPYDVGNLNVNNFHGILGWNFGPDDALIRPFVYGGAGVTRYGDTDYTIMQAVTTPATATRAASTTVGPVSATLPGATKFSTTWGLGVTIAPRKGLGIRVAGNVTPARLNSYPATTSAASAAGTPTSATYGTVATAGTTATSVSTTSSWWCNAFSGCPNKSYVYANQWSITGGLSFRF